GRRAPGVGPAQPHRNHGLSRVRLRRDSLRSRKRLDTLPMFSVTKLQRSVVLAVRSLWLHKLRSALSVLGIIIGNVAVISLLAFGEGSKQDALADIRAQGATNIIIRSIKPPDAGATGARNFIADYGLKNRDYEQFLTIPGL